MSNKNKTIALASLIAAGAGVAAVAASNSHKQAKAKKIAEKQQAESGTPYRNTERGKYEKNSKGIYYTNGNYEAFAHPKKPEGVDEKSAYIVGSGLASLAAACFLVRDGQMPGDHIHILEAMDIAGGACVVSLSIQRLCDARRAVRWRTILNVCGISSAVSLPLRHRAFPYSTNITG